MHPKNVVVFIALFFSACNIQVLSQVVPDENFAMNEAHLPLVFEPNRGQAESGVRFVSRGKRLYSSTKIRQNDLSRPGRGRYYGPASTVNG